MAKTPIKPKPNETKLETKKWLAMYMKSDLYNKRLAESGQTLPKAQIQDMLNSHIINNPKEGSVGVLKDEVNMYKKYPEMFTKLDPSLYNNLKANVNNININPSETQVIKSYYKDNKNLNPKMDEIMAHELSHVSRHLSDAEQYLINGMSNRKASNLDEHDSRPTEQKADLDALRYLMYKKGIYDTSKRDMTIEDLKKAKNDKDIKQSLSLYRLLKAFNEEDIINLNNMIAMNKKDSGNAV